MSDIVERLRRGPVAYISDSGPVYAGPISLELEAADEILRLRAELATARDKALEEASTYHDGMAARHEAAHRHVESDHHMMMERQHRRDAAAIRALKEKP